MTELPELSFRILGRQFTCVGAPASVRAWLARQWDFPEYDDLPKHPYSIVVEWLRVPRPNARVRASFGTQDAGVHVSESETGSHLHCWGLSTSDTFTHLYVALADALRASGLIPLHAAIMAKGGTATAFLAPSGTGKSSTLIQGIHKGWSPIAEDFAWLDPETMIVYGWDRGIRLWPSAKELLNASVFSPWVPMPDGKLFLSYTSLLAPEPRRAELSTLAILTRTEHEPSTWQSISARDTVRTLWESTGVPSTQSTRTKVARHISTILSRLALAHLTIGNTPLPL